MPRLAAALVVCALATLYWLPLFGRFSTTVPSFYPDLYEFLWNFWMFENHPDDALANRTEKIFAPYGSSLALHTSVPGVVIPLVTVVPHLSLPVLFNITVLVLVVMNLLSAAWCLRRFGVESEIATLGAALITFHPFFFGHLQAGHLNFLCFSPVLIATALAATVDRPLSAREGILLSVALTWSALTNLYYFYFSIVIVVSFGVLHVLRQGRSAGRLAIAVLAGTLLSAPSLHAVWSARGSALYTSDHDPAKHSADISQIFLPGERQMLSLVTDDWVVRPSTLLGMHETSVYIPWSLLVCAAGVVVFRPPTWRRALPFVFIACLSGLLCCGPSFTLFGEALFGNPIFQAARVLPAFPSVPARFGILTMFFLVCALVIACGREKKWIFVTLLVAILEIFPRPLRVLDVVSTPVLDRLAQSSLTRLVDADGVSNMVLGAQIFHGRSVVGGFLSRRPKKVESEYRRNVFLAALWYNKPATPAAIWNSFSSLGADGVLVRRTLHQSSALMSGLPCFRLIDEDGAYQLFVPADGTLCAP